MLYTLLIMNRKFLAFAVSISFLCFVKTTVAQQSADILITNARILDGSGSKSYKGSIAIANGKIIAIGRLKGYIATQTINAKKQIAAPGFIDVHTHTEGDELRKTDASSFLYDGVTSVITGNCGSSRTDLKKYFAYLDSLGMGINIGSLVGHNDVRKDVMGRANRNATEEELRRMEKIVADNMQAGAVGLSTGLIYIPGAYAPTEEIVRLAKVAKQYGGVYATHMRNEGDSVVNAINEALTIGREADIPVEISHFKVSGQQNWGRSSETLAMVEDARRQGMDVTIDQYPYTASSTSLSTILPDWALADGQDSIVARIDDGATNTRIVAAMLANLKKRKLEHYSYAVVASYRTDPTLNGKSIEQINQLWNRPHTAESEAETILDMMKKGGAGMVFHGMSEDDVRYFMRYPHNMIASDADIRIMDEGNPHPRGYGSNARVLAKYVREEKIVALPEAVRRMTSLPATKFGLKTKGLLQPGMDADIVIFNPKTITDKATFDKPHQYSKGFNYVLVNGVPVIENGVRNDKRPGRVIRK